MKNLYFKSVFFLPLVIVLANSEVQAHGSFEEPLSRVYGCYLEGPENPISAACQAMVAEGGTQALYDWKEVNQGGAGGNHIPLIPDGTLCGAGRDKYKGLNLGRDDWVASLIAPNSDNEIEFIYYATAPHLSEYFDFYVTNDSYDLNNPLKWSDLEPAFCEISEADIQTVVEIVGGESRTKYLMSCPMPTGKTGKHIIYNIWQRNLNQSNEAFYACIDVDFGEGNVVDLIFKHDFEISE
jgi:chitin-binding protein